jgi:glutaredoxin 3
MKDKKMKNVIIYTTSTCPYCAKAKGLLRKKNVVFTEIDVNAGDDIRDQMATKANGRRSVPQIFIGATHVGGCDDLHDLEATGQLDQLLAA